MKDEIVVNLQDCTKLFVVCPNPNCATEIGFDLTKRHIIKKLYCPVCDKEIYGVEKYEREFTWPFILQRLLEIEHKPQMKFRVPRSKSGGSQPVGTVATPAGA